jgi:hypothetical protein
MDKNGFVSSLRSTVSSTLLEKTNQELIITLQFSSIVDNPVILSLCLPITLTQETVNTFTNQCGSRVSQEISRILSEFLDPNGSKNISHPNDERSNSSDLVVDPITSSDGIYNKFQVGEETAVSFFGNLSYFYQGLEARIGLPDFRVELAIRREHCDSADSEDDFKTFNYGGIVTTPSQEYEFVVEPDLKKNYPGITSGRSITPLKQLESHPFYTQSGLTRSELIALRLFTGPMYMKYNAFLRHHPISSTSTALLPSPPAIYQSLKGNHYCTTISLIVSGIIKLSRTTPLPPSRRVYRGLSGLRLPEKFWKPDSFGCCGGVELGFMSTTSNINIALMYSTSSQRATHRLGTIFEIDVGQIDRGAAIDWLSQYPAEEEFLVPPLSNLEVMGKPEVRMMEVNNNHPLTDERKKGIATVRKQEILVVKLRVNVNLKSKTIEELIGTRKMLHVTTLANLFADTVASLKLPSDAALLSDFNNLIQKETMREPEYFNDDVHYRVCLEDMMNMKVGTRHKDEIIRLAQRVLCGKRSNEIADLELKEFENETSLNSFLNYNLPFDDVEWPASLREQLTSLWIEMQSKRKNFLETFTTKITTAGAVAQDYKHFIMYEYREYMQNMTRSVEDLGRSSGGVFLYELKSHL